MLVTFSSRILKKRKVIGFDINKSRVKELKLGKDKNLEFKIKN